MSLFSRVRAAIAAAVPEFYVPAPSQPYARPQNNIAEVDAPSPAKGPVRPRAKTRKRPRNTPLPVNITRWIQADVEDALHQASSGSMTQVAQLHRAFGRDGIIKGLWETRYGGLLRLPRVITGDTTVAQLLTGSEGHPGMFDAYFPPAELKKLAEDGESLGVGVAEFIQGEQDAHPVLVRLDPEFLCYRWSEDTWYYRTLRGLEPITPGDGHWILHTPKGRYEPWNHGDWQSLARGYVSKEHAIYLRENWMTKFSTPARVAVSPQGASEDQKQSWFQKVMDWGTNQVFGMTPGYDVKMLEVSGSKGIEIYQQAIDDADKTFAVVICGQTMTVDGGVGFANSGVGITVRADLIQQSGNSLAATLNTQALPFVAFDISGGRTTDAAVAWDTRPPQDLKAGADSLTAAGTAIEKLSAELAKHGLALDVKTLVGRYAIPVLEAANDQSAPPAPEPPSPAGSPAPALTPDLAPPEEELTPDDISALAAKMTEFGIPRCEHGSSNRCRLCGIERVRDFEPGQDGAEHTWKVAWRPIPKGGLDAAA